MKATQQKNLATVQGDGGPVPVRDAALQLFKDGLKQIDTDAARGVMCRRILNESTRFCTWSHQNDDGRKHDAEGGDYKAFPYNGASDGRIRMADYAVNDRVRLCVAAWNRGVPKVAGNDLQGAEWGERMQTLLDHEVHTVMGQRARVELKRYLNYVHGDSPAAALMGVYWHQETGLRMEKVKLEDLVALAVEQMQQAGLPVGEQEEVVLLDMLRDEAQEQTALEFFRNWFKRVKPARALKAVRQLRTTGECQLPLPYVKKNEPRWVAHRLYEDLFMPPNTAGDFQNAPYYHIREWMTETKVRAAAVTEGWSQDFITAVLKHEGASFFPQYVRTELNEVAPQEISAQENRGNFEILRTYFKATNDDDIEGVFMLTWHHAVDFAAHERVLLDYPHGDYPGVYLQREVVNARLVDTRGVPELMAGDQLSAKTLHDLTVDRAEITTIPPVFVPANRPDIRLKIGPLSQIKRNRREDYEVMNFGTAQDHDKALDRIERRTALYYGQRHKDIAPEETAIAQQDYVDDFLAALQMIYWQTLQLCQYYMDEGTLRSITGARSNEPLFRTLEEIQGKFGLNITVNIADVTDPGSLLKKYEMISKHILPDDSTGTINRARLSNRLMRGLDPNLADEVCDPVNQATQRELDDEDNNLAKIAAGIEPEMKDRGQNYAARLERLMASIQKNPLLQQRIAAQPDSQEILDRRVQHLQFMIQQFGENRQTGRVGAKPALEDQKVFQGLEQGA